MIPDGAIDIGGSHFIEFTAWRPDRILNPQYSAIPWEEKAGITIWHPRKDNGKQCCGHVTLDTPGMRASIPNRPKWTIESLDPLTISPSILCSCGDHGYIRNGKWESS